MYNKGLFYDWVPKPLMMVLILLLLFPLLSVNGVYTGNISYMVGGMGIMTEDVMMANYATIIGMSTVLPVIMRSKMRFRVKETMITSLVVLALLSYICATTTSATVVIFASFFIGFFKLLAMVELILPIMFILAPDGNRSRFFAVFYPMSIVTGQVSSYLLSKPAFQYGWESVHFYMAALLLLLALVCVVFMHNQRFCRKLPLYYIDWLSMLLFAVSFMLLGYVMVYAKQQAWFVSQNIRLAAVGAIVSFVLLALRQPYLRNIYLDLSVFKKSNVVHGTIMLLMLGIFLAASSLQSALTTGVLGYDILTNNRMNLLTIPGIIAGGVIGALWFNKGLPIKFYIFLGFGSYLLYCVLLYFMMVPELNFSYWVLPMFLRGLAMCILFIGVWFYATDGLTMQQMMGAAGLLLVVRSFVAVGAFSAVFSWLQYKLQWQSAGNLATYLDSTMLGGTQGGLAAYRGVQINALLAANKALLGYIIIAGMGVLLYILLHKFGKINYRRIIVLRKIVRGKSIQGYRLGYETSASTPQDIEDAAGAVAV